MSIEEVKAFLHEGIENIDDVDFLEALQETISMKYVPFDSVVLTEAQKKSLDRAHEQFKRGEFLTEDQANESIERWLKK